MVGRQFRYDFGKGHESPQIGVITQSAAIIAASSGVAGMCGHLVACGHRSGRPFLLTALSYRPPPMAWLRNGRYVRPLEVAGQPMKYRPRLWWPLFRWPAFVPLAANDWVGWSGRYVRPCGGLRPLEVAGRLMKVFSLVCGGRVLMASLKVE